MAKNKAKKVVVTGGTGFIGNHLVNALVDRGFTVHVISSSQSKKDGLNPKAIFHQADIRNIETLRPILKETEFVFHLASAVGERFSIEFPKETNFANIDGTIHLLTASKEAHVKRFIFSSSSAVYGDQNKLPHTENMMVNPKSPYGAQKYIGELYCKIWSELYGLPTVSLRYFSVYGPRPTLEYPRMLVIDQFLKNKKEGDVFSIIGNGKETRDFIHVHDVVQANLLAAESQKVGNGEVINIGSGKNYSIQNLAKLIGGKVAYTPARFGPKHTLADISKAQKLLGWKPKITLEKGILELKRLFDIE